MISVHEASHLKYQATKITCVFCICLFSALVQLTHAADGLTEKPAETTTTGEWGHEKIRRFPAAEARQGVAVDQKHFYAIDNYKIGKYSKETGQRVSEWIGRKGGPIKHLNAGLEHFLINWS